MTPREFCEAGRSEPLKGAAHAAAAGLLSVMAAYNVAAWAFRPRPERHLAVNAVLYTVGAAWEVRQAARHWRREP